MTEESLLRKIKKIIEKEYALAEEEAGIASGKTSAQALEKQKRAASDEQVRMVERAAAAAQQRLEIQQLTEESLRNTIAATESLSNTETDIVKQQKLKLDAARRNLELQELLLKKAKEEDDVSEDHIRNIHRATAALQDQEKQMSKVEEHAGGVESAAQGIATALGIGGGAAGGAMALGKHVKGAAVVAGGMGAALAAIGARFIAITAAAAPFMIALAGIGAGVKLMSTFVSTTKEAVINADALRSRFVALTGDVSEARTAFIDLTLANLDLAIGFEEMQNAQLGLRSGFVDFVFLSKSTRDSLTLQSAAMAKLGIDNRTTGETVTMLTQSFRQSGDEALQTQRNIIGFGRAFGIEATQIVSEFNRIMPSLAEFGDNAEEVFKGLVIASRESGVSVSDLTSTFGDAMNTFESSAKVAGALNAVLGTGMVNSMDLLRATTDERIELLKESLELSGRDFDSMGRFEKVTFAAAVGLRDVDEASRIFGNTQDDLATKIGDTTITQEEMNNLAREATDSFTQLKYAFMSFAVAVKPVTEGFAIMVDKFIEMGEGFPGGVAGLISMITGAAGALSFVVGGVMAMTGVGTPVGLGMMAGGAGMIGAGIAGGAALSASESIGDGRFTFEKDGRLSVLKTHPNDTITGVAAQGISGLDTMTNARGGGTASEAAIMQRVDEKIASVADKKSEPIHTTATFIFQDENGRVRRRETARMIDGRIFGTDTVLV